MTDKFGYNKLGYNKLGYNKLSYNKLGYNKLSYNKLGYKEHSVTTSKVFNLKRQFTPQINPVIPNKFGRSLAVL